jgi:hypothetical protein
VVHKPDRGRGAAHSEQGGQVGDRFKRDRTSLREWNEHAEREQKVARKAVGASLGIVARPLRIHLKLGAAESILSAIIHPVPKLMARGKTLAAGNRFAVDGDDGLIAGSDDVRLTSRQRLLQNCCAARESDGFNINPPAP